MYSSTSNSSITAPKMLFWKDVTLPDEWVLKQELPPREVSAQNSDLKYIQQYLDGTKKKFFRWELQPKEGPSDQDIKLEGISTRSQVTSAYYSTKDDLKSKGKSIKEEVQVEDDAESTSPTASDMVAPIHPSLCVLDKALDDLDSELLVIDMINLHADFMSKENHDKQKTYHRIYSISEKQKIRKEWKKKMYKDNKHILFFDFLENHYVSKKDNSKQYLNVLKSSFIKEEGRKVVKTSHPPLETILVSVKGKKVKASPFKISDPGPNENVFAETKKIIEQNNFVNQTLYTIGQQLDRIKDKVEKPASTSLKIVEKPASTSLKIVEKPLIVLPEDRSKIHFGVTNTMAKLDQMLAEVKQGKPSVSVLERNSPGVNFDDSFSVYTWNDSDDDFSLFDNSLVQKIDLLEKEFQDLQVEKPELARIYSRDIKPIGLTKNWYSRPTPPDLHYEERGSHSQFSVSADQMYEWNIDGFSEQEILNTLNRMSMVVVAYYNNKLSQPEIVDILTHEFSGMLRAWWDKHLTTKDRETIRLAIKKDEEGLPILDTEENRREGTHGSPDGVNTLIYTIVKHFYKDVFMSRVMLREDSQKPYWKEKFIDGLPRLFAIKVKDSLTDTSGYLNYDNYTYGDIVSMIQTGI
ncbi:hypothetical protein I3843_08G108200, partial [Carya illinoinensis]